MGICIADSVAERPLVALPDRIRGLRCQVPGHIARQPHSHHRDPLAIVPTPRPGLIGSTTGLIALGRHLHLQRFIGANRIVFLTKIRQQRGPLVQLLR